MPFFDFEDHERRRIAREEWPIASLRPTRSRPYRRVATPAGRSFTVAGWALRLLARPR
ncbi:hypothetical protein [Acuticoccus yangtzensis]|uniref:hypothetical protein n=1 Tax=Acuticoccus yangtzensis TaxID=1443441 RepID=UPI000A419F2F|nr:hypothetical protein [Acuticoccus yangtzensis]